MLFSPSSPSSALPCHRCSEPISVVEQLVPTASRRLYHRHCFVCSKCARSLSLEQYGVYQDTILCPSCFVAQFTKAEPGKNGQNRTINGDIANGTKANGHYYEDQLRTLQLGEDDGDEDESESEDEEDGGRREMMEERMDGRMMIGMEMKNGTESPGRGMIRRAGVAEWVGIGMMPMASPIPEEEAEEAEDAEDGDDHPAASSLRHNNSSDDAQHSVFSPVSAATLRNPPWRVLMQASSSEPQQQLPLPRAANCKRCAQRVFEAEKVVAASKIFHRRCFRCAHCDRSIELGKFSDHSGDIFCNGCYAKKFGPKGIGCGVGAGILQMHQ